MQSELPRRVLRILHVDDDIVDAINLQRLFKKMNLGFDLKQASNGKQALEVLRRREGCLPDVILLDLNMPVMGGLEFLKELRSDPELQRITVFVLSTSDYPKDIQEAYAHNVAGFLVKPLSSAKFNALVENLVNLWSYCEFPCQAGAAM